MLRQRRYKEKPFRKVGKVSSGKAERYAQFKATRQQLLLASGYGRKAVSTGELKFHDLDIDDAQIAAAGSIAEDSCNAIAQGVTESQRIGRKCSIKSINWRFEITQPTKDQAVSTADTARIILYLDKQANGAAATITGILESADYQSFNNLSNKGRFLILMDRMYDVYAPAGAYDGTGTDWSGMVIHDAFFKKCDIPIEFDSTTGAITEVRSNNIGVLTISKGGSPGFASKMRLRFSDGS